MCFLIKKILKKLNNFKASKARDSDSFSFLLVLLQIHYVLYNLTGNKTVIVIIAILNH